MKYPNNRGIKDISTNNTQTNGYFISTSLQPTSDLRSIVDENILKEPSICRRHSRDKYGLYYGLILTLVILAELWGESGCTAVQPN
jgi:hypothetical protein